MRIGDMPRGSVAHVVETYPASGIACGAYIMLTTAGWYRPGSAAGLQGDPRVQVELDATGLTDADFDLLERIETAPRPGPDGTTLTLHSAILALSRLRNAEAQRVLDTLLRTYEDR